MWIVALVAYAVIATAVLVIGWAWSQFVPMHKGERTITNWTMVGLAVFWPVALVVFCLMAFLQLFSGR